MFSWYRKKWIEPLANRAAACEVNDAIREVLECDETPAVCDFSEAGRVSEDSMPSEGAMFHDKTDLFAGRLPIFAVDVKQASCDASLLCFPQHIGAGEKPKVCVVSGPTGSGKTTSLIAAASQAVDPVAFISFGHSDSEWVLYVFRDIMKAIEGDAEYYRTLRGEVLLPLAMKLLRGLILDRLYYVQLLGSAASRIRAQADVALYDKARSRSRMEGRSHGLEDFDVVHIIFDECNVLFHERYFGPDAENVLSLFIEAALSVTKRCTVSVCSTVNVARISASIRGVCSGGGSYDPELIYVSPRPLSVEQIESFFDRYSAHVFAQKVHRSEEGELQSISKWLAGARARTLGLAFQNWAETRPDRRNSPSEAVATAIAIISNTVLSVLQGIDPEVLLCVVLDPSQLKSTQANRGSELMTAFGFVEPENRPVIGEGCTVADSALDCWSHGFLHEDEVRGPVLEKLHVRRNHSGFASELANITARAPAISCGYFAEMLLGAVVATSYKLLVKKYARSEDVENLWSAELAAAQIRFLGGNGNDCYDVGNFVRSSQDPWPGANMQDYANMLYVILADRRRFFGADFVVLWQPGAWDVERRRFAERGMVIFFRVKWTDHAECADLARQVSGHEATPTQLKEFEKLKDSQFVRVVLCLHKSGSGGCEQDLDFERLGNTELARQFSDHSTWYHVGIRDTVQRRCVTPSEVEEQLMKAEPVPDSGADSRKMSKCVVVEKNDGPEMKKRRAE